MLDRSRAVIASWSALALGLFLVLAVGIVGEWAWLGDVDDAGKQMQLWAADSGLRTPLRVIEVVFATTPMIVYTAVIAALLFSRKHRRAAIYLAGVMLTASLAFWLLKRIVERDRPEWQLTQWSHLTHSFPSGHATAIAAFATASIVLVIMLVRRANMRRLLCGLAVLAVIVVGLDRILLGRHFPTDVVGGILLGSGLALIWLAVYTPLPRPHAAKVEPLPVAGPRSRKMAVILNPIKVEDVDAFKNLVETMAADSEWAAPMWHFTTVEDPGTGQAELAAVDGAELVIVCGGDGTVREVCAELAGTGIPVGIVPAGTGNLLARNLGLPLFMRAAIDIALNGQDRAIDLVDVHGEDLAKTHFMVMAGMGLDAAIMEGVNPIIKEKVGWLAYVVSGFKALMSPVIKVEISVDDAEPTTHRARTVVVGNVGYLQAGMPLLPDAAIDDGLLDVVILYPRRFLSWVPMALRVLTKRQRTDDTVNRMTGRTVTITAAGSTPRQLDGDAVGPGRTLVMECIPGRALVRVAR